MSGWCPKLIPHSDATIASRVGELVKLDSLTDGFNILDTSANALEATAILLALDTARLPAR